MSDQKFEKADIFRAEQLMDELMAHSPSAVQIDLLTTYLLSMIIEHRSEEYAASIFSDAIELNEFIITCNAPTHVEH